MLIKFCLMTHCSVEVLCENIEMNAMSCGCRVGAEILVL